MIRRADTLCPASQSQTWTALENTLSDLGRWTEALQTADLIDRSPGADPAARAAAAAARAGAKQEQTATGNENQAKNEARHLLIQAMKARDAGDKTQARATFLRAWERWPHFGQAAIEAGLLTLDGGDPSEAQRLLDRGIARIEISAGVTMLPKRLGIPIRSQRGPRQGCSRRGPRIMCP